MESPGYQTAPHEWGLKAGFIRRCFVARTFTSGRGRHEAREFGEYAIALQIGVAFAQ
jgi:hypothetical protein